MTRPFSARNDDAAFEHHQDLPCLELKVATATVIVGDFDTVSSPVRRDTDHVGVELNFRGGSTVVALDPSYECAIIVVSGELLIDGRKVTPRYLAYLEPGREECEFTTKRPCKAILVGGAPFTEKVLMLWNFVARTQNEIAGAWPHWTGGDERFGVVASSFQRIEVGPPPWVLHNT